MRKPTKHRAGANGKPLKQMEHRAAPHAKPGRQRTNPAPRAEAQDLTYRGPIDRTALLFIMALRHYIRITEERRPDEGWCQKEMAHLQEIRALVATNTYNNKAGEAIAKLSDRYGLKGATP